MKINILPGEVYNRISAGEVVESPRSVVKELAENSIDAGATAVSIYIEDGGIKSVSIVDDGCGIEKSEVKKAFLPHATSKIATADDLLTLSTLGFRGEALASIAAVSEVTLVTRYQGSDDAVKIVVESGKVIKEGISQIEKGTNITVKNLFYNTPARFKFLKSHKSEENAVTQTVQGLILANPNVAVKYYVDGVLKLSSDGTTFKSAADVVLGAEFADESLRMDLCENGIRVGGYISSPRLTRGNRLMQFLIINGRVVVDQTISAVVQNAYQERLMTRSFPLFVIDLIMPFDMVDVNVHPNKLEVRLSNPRLVHALVYRAVKNALEDYDKLRSSTVSSTLSQSQSTLPPTLPQEEAVKSTELKPNFGSGLFESEYKNLVAADLFAKPNEAKAVFEQPSSTTASPVFNPFVSEARTFAPSRTEQTSMISETDIKLLNYNVVGQLFSTYILVECGTELILIDQHAAHERILYNRFFEAFRFHNCAKQDLLLPFVYAPLTEADYDNISQCVPLLREMGFEISKTTDSFTLTTVPAVLTELSCDSLFDCLCDELRINNLSTGVLIKEKLAKAACKAAIKGGDNLSAEEISFFVEYYIKEGAPLQCPHGRPTVVKVKKTDIEKKFKRIV